MFLLNSRLGHFSAPPSPGGPFSLSYGASLPSSLAVIHSSTSGFSPHPPVSVYGTGRRALGAGRLFSRVWLPALSGGPGAPRTVGSRGQSPLTPFNADFRRRAAVSLPGRRLACETGCGILTARPSPYPFGIGLGPGLPWDVGRGPGNLGFSVWGPPGPIVVTHAYIFFSVRSSAARATPSARDGMLPYRRTPLGGRPTASAAAFTPDHHPRTPARLVSCYALFEWIAASKLTS